MNDKDKEAFEKWWMEGFKGMSEKEVIKYRDVGKQSSFNGWQAACEYKNKEYSDIADARMQTSFNNVKLQAENAKLRELVKDLARNGMDCDIASRIEELEKKYPKGSA